MQSSTYPPRLTINHFCDISRKARRLLRWGRIVGALWLVVGLVGSLLAQTIAAVGTPLLLPAAVAMDAQGNVYVAETNNQVIRRIDSTGMLTTIAGNGTQGFAGDNGRANAAQLDTPTGIAVDAAGDLYIADSHNQRIRRVDAATGIITTVVGGGVAGFAGDGGAATLASLNLPSALALDSGGDLYIVDTNNHRVRKVSAATGLIVTVAGDGLQRFSGDGGAATAASIDSPGGVAVDAAGNLYLADTHNHRVRMVSAATGLISTVAGTGSAAFSGDGAAAANAALALPHGLTVDASGTVYVADSNNQRVRRIARDGTITTVAGNGTQGFAGDGGAAIAASLDTPRGATLSPAGLVTVADTGNQRIRQVAADATIATIAGQGGIVPATLTIAAPASITYGSGALTATLATSSQASGRISLIEITGLGASTLGSAAVAGNVVVFSLAGLAAGTHRVYFRYDGDLTHAAAQSATAALVVTAAQVAASANSASMVYGQAIPGLTGSLTGVLGQDAGKLSLVLSTAATGLSPVGSYPIVAALSGPAAGNYVLTPLSGAVLTINKAASVTTLFVGSSSDALSVTVHLASTTSGTPTGSVLLLDGSLSIANLPLLGGNASFTTTGLSTGSHTLTAVYTGDGNFAGSASSGEPVVVTPVAAGDFTLAATGPTSQTVVAGSSASFAFAVQMQGAALASPILLAASALPVGMTANFSPAYLPPGGAVTAFTMTVQTAKAAASGLGGPLSPGRMVALSCLLLPLLPFGRRGRRRLLALLSLGLLVVCVGCGARIVSTAASQKAVSSYPIVVSATATGASGGVLLHTVTVMVNVP